MQHHTRSRSSPLQGALLATALATSGHALALSNGAGASFVDASSPWAGVGSLNVNGELFTATLIAPGYALTAAHVVAGSNVDNITFQTQGGLTFASGVNAVFLNPAYTGSTSGNAVGDPTIHADLAIVRLDSASPSTLPHYSVFGGALLHQTLSLVSYGHSATLATTGANKADLVLNSTQGQAESYVFDHDGPTLVTNRIGPNTPANGTLGATVEAGIVQGDSGSAAFVQVNGVWQLAGINTFALGFTAEPLVPGAFGTGGGGVVLSSYEPWISSVIATTVPEPSALYMLVSGLGLVGAVATRRRKAGL